MAATSLPGTAFLSTLRARPRRQPRDRQWIPIPGWLIDELRDHVDAANHAGPPALDDRIFKSPRGKAMLDHTLWRIVSRACDSAGLERIRPYDLRHSHASLLIDIGAHPKAISERMGHAEIGVAMNVYGHIFEGKQRELSRDLDDLLGRTRSSKRHAGTDEGPDVGPDENSAT